MRDLPFHVRLTMAREAANMTQVKLAAIVGVSDRFMRSYEAGDKEPGVTVLRKMCAALGVTASSLVDPVKSEWTTP